MNKLMPAAISSQSESPAVTMMSNTHSFDHQSTERMSDKNYWVFGGLFYLQHS